MYTRDTLVLLKHYLESGLSKTAIAAHLGISRGLVYHLLRTGQLDRDLDAAATERARRPAGVAKLAAVTPLIEARLATYPALSAVRLFAECQAAGYTGGYSQLTALVRRLRPAPSPEPVVRFETAPGEQAQFDFATVKLPWGVRYALVMVLGFSRLLYVEFVLRQTALSVMLGMERAFAAFGGVPRHVLFDQMKSVIVDDQRPDGRGLLGGGLDGGLRATLGQRRRLACERHGRQGLADDVEDLEQEALTGEVPALQDAGFPHRLREDGTGAAGEQGAVEVEDGGGRAHAATLVRS